MNKIIQSTAEFFRSKNITSHTIVVLIVTAAGIVTSDEQVRSFLVGACVSHPKIASSIIAVAGIIMKYSRDSSTRGAAMNIMSDAKVDPRMVTIQASPVSVTAAATPATIIEPPKGPTA